MNICLSNVISVPCRSITNILTKSAETAAKYMDQLEVLLQDWPGCEPSMSQCPLHSFAVCIPLLHADRTPFCICCIQSFAWNCLVSQRATFSSRGRRMKHQVCRPWKHQVCRLWNITPRIREESGTPTPTASCDENPSLLRLAWA